MRRANFTSVRVVLGEALNGVDRGVSGAPFKRTMASQGGRQRHCLGMDTLNPNIKVLEYAVRGPLVTRAGEIEKELEKVSFRKKLHWWQNNHMRLVVNL